MTKRIAHTRSGTTTGQSGRQRQKLLAGVSALVIGLGVGVVPAHAQLARLRQVLGGAVVPTAATTQAPVPTAVRGQSMQQALAQQQANRATIASLRALVTQAQSAALAAVRTKPSDGLSTNGLSVAVTKPTLSVDDPTGLATWQGALLPTQTVTDGKYSVTIKQTDSRALLSWNRFDVGANTTLTFDQTKDGKAQTDWVVLNRVVDPKASPTTILGQIKASGTVLIINRNGVIFGNGAQVNTHSLLVSSLEIGNFGRDPNAGTEGAERLFTGLSIKDRNTAYLTNGLLGSSVAPLKFDAMLTSSLTGTGNYSFLDPNAAFSSQVEGDVIVDRGASLTAQNGGFLIVTAPHISNDGVLSAPEGQVSLQAGRAINYSISTGASNSLDPDIRGIILRSTTETGGSVVNSGLIDVPRGYISLGADLTGSVTNSGLIASTTSVSRNGVISLTAGHVTVAGDATPGHAGAIAILPDDNGETVPQGTAADPPSFKSSRIDIGGAYVSTLAGASPAGVFGPATVDFGANTLLFAPSAAVSIGGRASQGANALDFVAVGHPQLAGSISVADGAMIDVGGVKDVQLDVSRNSVTISPLKGNELRDTPNYRDVKTDGSFTLNGKTVTLDVRKHGVRSDGVAWIGSPLIEAGSAASQIGVTASELMTKGGSVTFKVAPILSVAEALNAPRVSIAAGATVDFSGGWVHYNAGLIRSTRLIRADGTIVDIADADPNGDYIGIADGYSNTQTKFGISNSFANQLLSGDRVDPAYDEGRDAGVMIVGAPTATLEGTLHGQAFAGQRQLEGSTIGTAKSAIASDPRKLQASASELPSGGFLRIGSFLGAGSAQFGGDILVRGVGGAETAAPGSFVLSDSQLSNAGLSALTLQTSGGVQFAAGSSVSLVDGGRLTVDAGRTIRFDGTIEAHGGAIAAQTAELGGNVLQSLLAYSGSPFTTADDVKSRYSVGEALPSAFDIVVGGTLDVAGQWRNDYLAARSNSLPAGTAWINGGTIALRVAPKVFVELAGADGTVNDAADLSGSLLINHGALLNVSSGGYVSRDGTLDLTALGGNIALIDRTVYASVIRTDAVVSENSTTDEAIGGANQSVTFTPVEGTGLSKTIRGALVPTVERSTVSFETASLKGFSFGGGGTFSLVAPSLSFGSDTAGSGPHIGLDFLQATGFGTLDLSAYRSRSFTNLFSNGITGDSAFLDTTRLVIGSGETLNLSQALLPNYVDGQQNRTLLGLATGSDVTSVLTAGVPTDAWDQKAATLKLGGLTELEVAQGGTITGAAGAAIVAPKLLNEGTIRIVGGSLTQRSALPEALVGGSIGVRDETLGGHGLDDVLGTATLVDGHRQYDENANALVTVNGRTVTNRELFSASGSDRAVYFLGKVDADTGIDLRAGSVTDLSGGLVLNTRAPFVGGVMLRTGRLYAGGSITTAAAFADTSAVFDDEGSFSGGRYRPVRGGSTAAVLAPVVGLAFNAAKGSLIDISGAAAELDIAVSGVAYQRTAEWTDGGTLDVLAGGNLTGSTLKAFGGAAPAAGGTLEWLQPVMRQSDGAEGPTAGVLTADWISASGFSTMIARGSLSLDGTLDLKLGKAFILSSADPVGSTTLEPDLRTYVALIGNGDAVIEAPYVRLSSRSQNAARTLPTGATSGSITIAGGTIDLVGGVAFAVPDGVTADGHAAGAAVLKADQDIRLTGVSSPVLENRFSGLTGAVVSTGDLRFKAAQVYATTGTGNLQQLLEDRRNGSSFSTATPFTIASLAAEGTVSFASNGGAVPDSPLSAGSWLRVAGAHVVQDGVLRAPLGLLDIGSSSEIGLTAGLVPVTQSIEFGAGSVTSVSGKGLNVPYGQTTDLTEYYFKPNANGALTSAPVGEMRLDGATINVGTGATIDGQGGGDVFAFEFVSGTGGSRDVLSRQNNDSFSSTTGFQYADGRQVYAILPVAKAGEIAAYDPIYSADYGAGAGDLYGANAGRTVWLDGGNGIAAGEYLLLPAHYALLPGAMRLVENTDAAAPFVDGSGKLRDGSVFVGGSYGTAGTAYRESVRRAFTVETSATFLRYSKLQTTSGTDNFNALATKDGKAAPRSPLDAARFVIRPAESLIVDGLFSVDPATGGRGAQFDIAASAVEIRAALPAVSTPGVLVLTTPTLTKLSANSLLIGGTRSDNIDGTTGIDVIGKDILVDRTADLELPELILAAGGADSRIFVAGGATIKATGTLSDPSSANYTVGYSATTAGEGDKSGIGAILRVSSGPERLVARSVDPSITPGQLVSSKLVVANGAKLSGNAIAFNNTGNVGLGDTASIAANNISLGGYRLDLSDSGLDAAVVAKLAAADQLTLQSQRLIALGSAVPAAFNNLVIDGPGFVSADSDIAITAKSLLLRNSGKAATGCSVGAVSACGSNHTISFSADTVSLGDGTVRMLGFEGGVTLAAKTGLYIEGKGSLAIDDPAKPAGVGLTLRTPFVADRSASATADVTAGGADYVFATTGDVRIDGTGLTGTPTTTAQAVGTRIAFGAADAQVASLSVIDSAIRATSGIVEAYARDAISISGSSAIGVPGFTTKIGASTDPVVATAGSGTIRLQSATGNIDLASGSSLAVDNGIGAAGALELVATRGSIRLGASLNPAVGAAATRDASLLLDGGSLLDGSGDQFDLSSFLTAQGRLFEGAFQIHTGTGPLVLAAGQTLKAQTVTLATDHGAVTIDGTINTSGDDVSGLKMTDPAYVAARVNGGDITLYGADGVTLGASARLAATTNGYAAADSRQASGGNVTLGITSGGAALTIAEGAVIDVHAAHTADRLVAVSVKDPNTLEQTTAYRQAAGDLGGTVTLRAPLIRSDSAVDVRAAGTVTGARMLTLDAFKLFDLDAIAASGAFSGVTANGHDIHLDAAATGKPNFLAGIDAAGSLPSFIRGFSVVRADGGSLAGYRLRPEAVLSSSQTIFLDSNLNLGAGRITDTAAAVAAGLLVESALGPDNAGNQRYEVVAGKEGELFSRFVDMTFRVGGKVTGEAGVLTMRAGGDLNIAGSVSDGFFAFHDRTDPAYINHQLGGGNRVYHPATELTCAGGGTCDDTLLSYSKYSTRVLSDDKIVVIDLTLPELGSQATPIFVHSPYSASANSVAANGTGNAIGTAELFPLVDGKPVASSDMRLVAGAAAGSADPLAIDQASRGSVIIAGEKSYSVVAKQGRNTLGGGVQLGIDDGFGDIIYGTASNFLTTTLADFVDPAVSADFYTHLNWGSGDDLADQTRAAALTFFAGHRFIKDGGEIVGVYASLGEVTQFLASDYGTKYTNLTRDTIGPIDLGSPVTYDQTKAYYRPVVRTGAGSIALAAAGNIDLVGSGRVVYRDFLGASRDEFGAFVDQIDTAKVGGSAVYTAGARLSGFGSDGSTAFTDSSEPLNFIPSPLGLLDAAPVQSGGGGAISLSAGVDVLGRRDIWGEVFGGAAADISTDLPGYEDALSTFDPQRSGDASQRWRVGTVGLDSNIGLVSQLFTSGIGALAGGNVTIKAGRDVSDLTVALDNMVSTSKSESGARVLQTAGSGNLALIAGRDLIGGQVDLAQGVGAIAVGRDVVVAGTNQIAGSYDDANGSDNRNLLRLRVNDATLSLSARGDVAIGGIGALGASTGATSPIDLMNTAGFYTPIAGVGIATIGKIELAQNRPEQRVAFMDVSANASDEAILSGYVLPPSLALSSLTSDVIIGNGRPELLYPSQFGQLSLRAGGDISNYALSMSDANASDLPGAFTVTRFFQSADAITRVFGLGFSFGGIIGQVDDPVLRLYHDRDILHRDDSQPVEIAVNGSMQNVHLILPKQARINAGVNLVDFYFEGQNLAVTDVTSIVAGRDILATTSLPSVGSVAFGKPFNGLTNFILGGPGALAVQAGRNLGPFLNSVTIGNNSYAGGIRTIGNEANPWLGSAGADIFALYGVAHGADYDGLAKTYLDPANTAKLDGDLFVQITDSAGNKSPDRGKPVYAPILAAWLRDHAPAVFASLFGTGTLSDSALAAAAWSKSAELYAAFRDQVDPLQQRAFLINDVYFGELAAPANPAGPSYQQYIRGYRAIQTLFPAGSGYTDNLATFTTDPATVTADHPLGEPTKLIVDGEPARATRIITGNVDLRLATMETARGGEVTILGPGGDFIAGSVVRTSTQAASKSTPLSDLGQLGLSTGAQFPVRPVNISSIPIGFEGVLSLRGGAIRSFTDGDFRLNQSRLFTLSGGNITMWSSNGDLNAGQGPKTSSNFPPIALRFTPDAFSEVDTAGSVSGAGIAALQPSVDVAPSSVTLLAPVGTVDAGDAGVRASGDVFVAAARVANADNFKVGGVSVGVPTTAVVAAPAAPPGANAATAATAAQARAQENGPTDRLSVIRVDVLGYIGGGDDCPSGRFDSQGKCVK